VTDVLEAVQSFIAKGYDREYRVKDGNLVDLELGSTLDPCGIRVDAALRLGSGDDGDRRLQHLRDHRSGDRA
jgi:hypothetical protein